MVSFIDAHRGEYGVEPICAVLPIAPSTYYVYKRRHADPGALPERAQRDILLRGQIRRVWQESRCVYGVRKVWRQLRREGIVAARCTVHRLMRQMSLQDVIRGRKFKTTIGDDSAARPRAEDCVDYSDSFHWIGGIDTPGIVPEEVVAAFHPAALRSAPRGE